MVYADFSFEQELWNAGFQYIAGIDEVGRGSWAGPVVAAAVIWPADYRPDFPLADSKLLTVARRTELAEKIKKTALAYSIGEVGLPIINREGIGRAAQRSFRQAVRNLAVKPDFHIVDAFYVRYLPKKLQLPLVKGDQKSASVAAASILAKVYRDQLMAKLAATYPKYGFDRHKGYGTKDHQEAIRRYGLSDLHRTSFDLNWLLSTNSIV